MMRSIAYGFNGLHGLSVLGLILLMSCSGGGGDSNDSSAATETPTDTSGTGSQNTNNSGGTGTTGVLGTSTTASEPKKATMTRQQAASLAGSLSLSYELIRRGRPGSSLAEGTTDYDRFEGYSYVEDPSMDFLDAIREFLCVYVEGQFVMGKSNKSKEIGKCLKFAGVSQSNRKKQGGGGQGAQGGQQGAENSGGEAKSAQGVKVDSDCSVNKPQKDSGEYISCDLGYEASQSLGDMPKQNLRTDLSLSAYAAADKSCPYGSFLIYAKKSGADEGQNAGVPLASIGLAEAPAADAGAKKLGSARSCFGADNKPILCVGIEMQCDKSKGVTTFSYFAETPSSKRYVAGQLKTDADGSVLSGDFGSMGCGYDFYGNPQGVFVQSFDKEHFYQKEIKNSEQMECVKQFNQQGNFDAAWADSYTATDEERCFQVDKYDEIARSYRLFSPGDKSAYKSDEKFFMEWETVDEIDGKKKKGMADSWSIQVFPDFSEIFGGMEGHMHHGGLALDMAQPVGVVGELDPTMNAVVDGPQADMARP